MKRGIIILFTVLGIFLHAQNIKTKRGIINLDGIPVAKLSNKSSEYTFMDLKETRCIRLNSLIKASWILFAIVISLSTEYITGTKPSKLITRHLLHFPEKKNLQSLLQLKILKLLIIKGSMLKKS